MVVPRIDPLKDKPRRQLPARAIRLEKTVEGTITSHAKQHKRGSGDSLIAQDVGAAPTSHEHDATGSTDGDAIHDNVASEISAITEKVTPVNADLVIIEDSADSNNKKRAQVGNLPGGGGGGADHNILDGSVHLDSVAQAVTRGSLIHGNSTPKWDELAIGAVKSVLSSDGTDPVWDTTPTVASITTTTDVITDDVNERTPAAGVVVDDVLLKDNTIGSGTTVKGMLVSLRLGENNLNVIPGLIRDGNNNIRIILSTDNPAEVRINYALGDTTAFSIGAADKGDTKTVAAIFPTLSALNQNLTLLGVNPNGAPVITVNNRILIGINGSPAYTGTTSGHTIRGLSYLLARSSSLASTEMTGIRVGSAAGASSPTGLVTDLRGVHVVMGWNGTEPTNGYMVDAPGGVLGDNRWGIHLGDITTNLAAGESAHGFHMEQMDAANPGTQWPFYYGDQDTANLHSPRWGIDRWGSERRFGQYGSWTPSSESLGGSATLAQEGMWAKSTKNSGALGDDDGLEVYGLGWNTSSTTDTDEMGWFVDDDIHALRLNSAVKFKVQISNITNIRSFVGLSSESLSTMVSAFNPSGDYVGIQIPDTGDRANSNFWFICRTGATQTAVDSGIAPNGLPRYYVMDCNGDASEITCEIYDENHTLLAVKVFTAADNIPVAGTGMRAIAAMEMGSTTATVFYLYYGNGVNRV